MSDVAKILIDSVFDHGARERRLRRQLQRRTFILKKSRKSLPNGQYVVLDAVTLNPWTKEMAEGMTLDAVDGWFEMMQEIWREHGV